MANLQMQQVQREVAKGLASRLRLKRIVPSSAKAPSNRREGAGISLEIETLLLLVLGEPGAAVAKGLASRLRLKHAQAGIRRHVVDAVAKGLASRLRLKLADRQRLTRIRQGREGAGISLEIETMSGMEEYSTNFFGREGAGISLEIETHRSY